MGNPEVVNADDSARRHVAADHVAVGPSLIFDLGMHLGQDTAFYLHKGFRVVAVDADPELCAAATERFAAEIDTGRLTIVNRAVSDRAGPVILYRNLQYPEWNTVVGEWAERNRRLGTGIIEQQVEAVTLSSLIAEHGVPYYLKVDIEGMDLRVVGSLEAITGRPTHVSFESTKVSFADLRIEFETLSALGYAAFKVVAQQLVPTQHPPRPAREGRTVDFDFDFGSSGLFGDEVPGPWLSVEEALEAYRPIFLRYSLTGDDPFVRSRLLRAVLNRVGFRAGWYD